MPPPPRPALVPLLPGLSLTARFVLVDSVEEQLEALGLPQTLAKTRMIAAGYEPTRLEAPLGAFTLPPCQVSPVTLWSDSWCLVDGLQAWCPKKALSIADA